jgi:hypothetical protein
VLTLQLSLPSLNSQRIIKWDDFFQIYREPVETFCIVPNNAPEKKLSRDRRPSRRSYDDFDDIYRDSIKSDWILNTISGLFSKFYIPERVRFSKNGIKIKLNDIVSYKVVIQKGKMKFYLTVPKKWSKQFLNAIKKDWGQVDINLVSEDIVKFNPQKVRAIDIVLKHHHCLSVKYGDDRNADPLYPALSSIGSTMSEGEKLLIDFNVTPVGESWKGESQKKFNKFKNGFIVNREEKTINGIIAKIFDFGDVIVEEMFQMIKDLMGVDRDDKEKREMPFKPEYTDRKLHANSRGFKVQMRAIAEADEKKRAKHLLKGVESAFENLNGDNKFEVRHIRTKRGIKSILHAVENNKPLLNKGTDIFFEKEMNQLIRVPNKQTLKENSKLIEQDNFTRTEIHNDFFDSSNEALPFARTLDKESKILHFGGYKREKWSKKGRLAEEKVKLDDRCEVTMISGKKGSGKTKMTVRQILQTFGVQYSKEEWAEKSKSVIGFDVADGSIITEVYNLIPDWLKHRVIILNHNNHERPIPVNFSDVEDFNRRIMKDEDFSYILAEMEANLVGDIVDSGKSILVDRWFATALQIAHMASEDYGIAEAMRILIDDEFRVNEVEPKITDERMKLELEVYQDLRNAGKADQIITVIQNRLNQLERDSKLWDCIAQKPLRNEDGSPMVDFRKWMDGDEDGAYLVLVYIPKTGVSNKFRQYLFAHYFLKIWQVALSREKGFAGREYRPETLVAVDEIHQIIDIPTVANVFVDLFKEVRKYSLRYLFTLHGWSSLSKSSKGKDIKNAILDNGANLIMLEGGGDMFESFEDFMGDYTIDDFNNLMKMQWCGIFSIRWQGTHVFQARMLPPADDEFKTYSKWDLYELSNYDSPYSRDKKDVRQDNLDRIRSILKKSILETSDAELDENTDWSDISA